MSMGDPAGVGPIISFKAYDAVKAQGGRPFYVIAPQDVMEAAFNAAKETYAEMSASNAAFKKIYDAMVAVRGDQYLWLQVSESTYDTFMMGQQRKKAL